LYRIGSWSNFEAKRSKLSIVFLFSLNFVKKVIVVSLMSATIATIIAWFSFAVNYPLAVCLDDSCETLQQILQNTVLNINNIQFLIGCLPPALFTYINGNATQGAFQLAQQLLSGEQNANLLNPANFNPITVNPSAHQNITIVALSRCYSWKIIPLLFLNIFPNKKKKTHTHI
jgi:hypothetical protein